MGTIKDTAPGLYEQGGEGGGGEGYVRRQKVIFMILRFRILIPSNTQAKIDYGY